MPRKATGSVLFTRGRWSLQITLGAGPGQRPAFGLPWCTSDPDAEARLAVLAELAAKLRAAGLTQYAAAYLERAAEAANEKALEVVRRSVEQAIERGVRPLPPAASITLQAFGEKWTSGELSRLYPAHVKAKSSAKTDIGRLERHVYPIVGAVPLDAFTIDHALEVLAAIPEERSDTTRRHVAQVLHRVLALATFPARLIATNPLPKGFLPKLGPEKAKGWIYPDEDAQLLGSPAVPLEWRIFYGFLHREGPRSSEALRLNCADIDLERGALTLDVNKTSDPRAWAMDPGVVRALRRWKEIREQKLGAKLAADAPVFVDETGARIDERHLAEVFREHLKAAGITRAALFESSRTRQQIRLHDTRGTFVTIALANGRTEAWVQDRSGHKSSIMINRYRRAARTAAELGLGDLLPLDVAIPELGAMGEPGAGNASGNANGEPSINSAGGGETEILQPFSLVAPPGVEPGRQLRPWILNSVMVTAPGRSASIPAQGGRGPGDPRRPTATGGCASGAPGCASTTERRAALFASLVSHLGELTAAGDLVAARVVTEAIASLLEPSEPATAPAPVVPIRRGGKQSR